MDLNSERTETTVSGVLARSRKGARSDSKSEVSGTTKAGMYEQELHKRLAMACRDSTSYQRQKVVLIRA